MKSNETFLNVAEAWARTKVRFMTHLSDGDYYAPAVINHHEKFL